MTDLINNDTDFMNWARRYDPHPDAAPCGFQPASVLTAVSNHYRWTVWTPTGKVHGASPNYETALKDMREVKG